MKILYTLLIVCVGWSSLLSQSVKKPLLTKRTATWCPQCGTWGWDTMKDLLSGVEDNALVFNTHYSGGLFTPLSADLAANFPYVGQPAFFLNGVNQNVLSSNWESKVTSIIAEVETINTEAPDFEINLYASHEKISNQNYEVRARVDVVSKIQDDGENYQLGIYLVRTDITAGQSPQSGSPQHPNIPVAEFSGNSFGVPLSATEGTGGEQNFYYNYENSLNVNNSFVAIVVWKEIEVDGEQFWEVINTEFTDNISAQTSNNTDLKALAELSVYQTNDRALNIQSAIEMESVQVLDLAGRSVLSTTTNQLKETQIDLPLSLISGTYIVQIHTEKGVISEKIFLK